MAALTDREISAYLVFRIKTNELIHLQMLWLAIKDGKCGESIFEIDHQIVRETLRTAKSLTEKVSSARGDFEPQILFLFRGLSRSAPGSSNPGLAKLRSATYALSPNLRL
jgi:hypothetical protein